jgi:hypothetical protein
MRLPEMKTSNNNLRNMVSFTRLGITVTNGTDVTNACRLPTAAVNYPRDEEALDGRVKEVGLIVCFVLGMGNIVPKPCEKEDKYFCRYRVWFHSFRIACPVTSMKTVNKKEHMQYAIEIRC